MFCHLAIKETNFVLNCNSSFIVIFQSRCRNCKYDWLRLDKIYDWRRRLGDGGSGDWKGGREGGLKQGDIVKDGKKEDGIRRKETLPCLAHPHRILDPPLWTDITLGWNMSLFLSDCRMIYANIYRTRCAHKLLLSIAYISRCSLQPAAATPWTLRTGTNVSLTCERATRTDRATTTRQNQPNACII